MSKSKQGQISLNAAEIYEQFYLPAIFSQWPEKLFHAGKVSQGMNVLDIACGTGVVARAAVDLVGKAGSVTGLDINPVMLEVARKASSNVNWLEGNAEHLPFNNDSFDSTFNQFGLMFFPDRAKAISEMARVTRPGGQVVIAVWDSLESTPGYDAMVKLLQRLFGDEVALSLTMPFCLGDMHELSSILNNAGVGKWSIETHKGMARFPSLESWIFTDVKGWTAEDQIDEKGFQLLLDEAQKDLKQFELSDGSVEFAAPAHICVLGV